MDSKHFKTANLNEGPTTVKNRKNIFGEIFRKFFIRFPGRISEIIWRLLSSTGFCVFSIFLCVLKKRPLACATDESPFFSPKIKNNPLGLIFSLKSEVLVEMKKCIF